MRFFQFGSALPATSPQAVAAVNDDPIINHDATCLNVSEVLPGRLQSIQRPDKATRSDDERDAAADSKRRPARFSLAPEPLNYLRLRRTHQSKVALQRNRQASASVAAAAREIVAPSPSPSPTRRAGIDANNNTDRIDSVTAKAASSPVRRKLPTAVESTAASRSPPSPTKDSTTSAIENQFQANTRQLREQHECEIYAASLADRQLRSLLLDLRRSQLARMAPPLLRVYERHKLRSRWRSWLGFVEWQRQESARLAQLTPFVVKIQRTFRMKRLSKSTSLEALRRARLVILYRQWEAAISIQLVARRWLRRRERYRQSITRYASQLQAVWRGRRERQEFRKTLKVLIRALLTRLAPAGSLHRLRDLAVSDPKLAATVNGMLSLLTETPVAVDRGRIPDYNVINGKKYARKRPPEPPKIIVTRAQLVHAVLTLRSLIQEREQKVHDAKMEFVDAQRQVRARREVQEREAKALRLEATNERLSIARELVEMDIAERETREYVRALRFVDEDKRRRAVLREQRRAWRESEHMRDEEAQTRYVVAERARREAEAQAKQREITRRENLLREKIEHEEAAQRAILEDAARRKQQLAQRRLEEETAERAKWNALSLELKSEVRQREEAAIARELAARASDAATIDERTAAILRKDQQRRLKHAELERERSEREAMTVCDFQSRQWHFAARKRAHELEWQAKRARERLRFAIDPLQFDKAQAHLEMEEARRRENYSLRLEDERSRAIHDREKREVQSRRLREQTRARLACQKREARERELMGTEEQIELARIAAETRASEYQRLLRDMQAKTQRLTNKQREQLAEARSRREMRDEELWQLSVARAMELAAIARDERERSSMEKEDRRSQQFGVEQTKYERKRRRERDVLRMMRADVESMTREDWEREGSRLEALLWTPMEVAAFAVDTELHMTLLYENVRVLIDLTDASAGSSPPLDLDYDAVRSHAAKENSMQEKDVPEKKRKPRKFFYHEFFEEDPILAPILNAQQQVERQETERRQREDREEKEIARKRWQQLAQHYLPRTLGSGEHLFHTRRGIVLMTDKRLDDARIEFMRAIDLFSHLESTGGCKLPPPSLFRQLARCNVALYEQSGRRECLDGAMLRFQQAAAHVWLVGNPQFLEELARALELAGKSREAAETLAGIVRGFPRYSRLSEVVFRAGVVLFTLHEFRQSREYLLHVLDDSPFDWQPADILFLVARVLQREGDPAARRLSTLAFEETFRKKRDAGELSRSEPHHGSATVTGMVSRFSTWQEFVKAPDTWRRAGDRYFSQGEFALAKDAFTVMVKRKQQLQEGPSLLTRKRRAVAAAVLQREQRQSQKTEIDGAKEVDDDCDDWLRVAKAYAAVQDRPKAANAVAKWLERASYTERVRERFTRWPIARWKLLTGKTAPAKIVRWRQDEVQASKNRRVRQPTVAWSEASTSGDLLEQEEPSKVSMLATSTEVAELDAS